MSNATKINHPFLLTLHGGVLDGHVTPIIREPEMHQRIEIDYQHEYLSQPDGSTKAGRTWQRYHYIYLGQGKATPLND